MRVGLAQGDGPILVSLGLFQKGLHAVHVGTLRVNRVVSDNFAVAYGANAATARTIVDRALDDWERVITNFNFSGGGNTFNVSISSSDLGPGTRGSTGGLVYDALQKPTSASITMDDNGGGTGWYFDSTPRQRDGSG